MQFNRIGIIKIFICSLALGAFTGSAVHGMDLLVATPEEIQFLDGTLFFSVLGFLIGLGTMADFLNTPWVIEPALQNVA